MTKLFSVSFKPDDVHQEGNTWIYRYGSLEGKREDVLGARQALVRAIEADPFGIIANMSRVLREPRKDPAVPLRVYMPAAPDEQPREVAWRRLLRALMAFLARAGRRRQGRYVAEARPPVPRQGELEWSQLALNYDSLPIGAPNGDSAFIRIDFALLEKDDVWICAGAGSFSTESEDPQKAKSALVELVCRAAEAMITTQGFASFLEKPLMAGVTEARRIQPDEGEIQGHLAIVVAT